VTCKKVPLTAAALLLMTTSPAQAREEIEDFLKNDWYEIEFFVFERSAVMDYDTTEALTLHALRELPHNITAQRPGEEGYASYYELDRQTKLCLVFPTLEYTLSNDHSADTELLSPDAPGAQTARSAAEQSTDRTGEQPFMDGSLTADSALLEGSPAPEIFPALEPHPLLDLMAQAARFEADLQERSDRWLPEDTHLLRREANIIENRGIGRILHHGRWLQAVPSREAPQPILIQGGERFSNSWEIAGTVAATLGRYLHFRATLFYHAPGLGLEPIEFTLRADGSSAAAAQQLDPFGYMLLNESRRMRSEEIHYLDHPKLGIVVRIDPTEIPAALLDAFEHLSEEDPENLGD